jgi:hypothetical protein
MSEQDFRQFIEDWPALNLSAFVSELTVDRINLSKIMGGQRKILKAKRGVFLYVAQKHGYVTNK